MTIAASQDLVVLLPEINKWDDGTVSLAKFEAAGAITNVTESLNERNVNGKLCVKKS